MAKLGKIYCEGHGWSHCCWVCGHLRRDEGLRYYTKKLPPGFPSKYMAWCESCDHVIEKVGAINKEAVRLMDLLFICMPCFESVARRNKWVSDVA